MKGGEGSHLKRIQYPIARNEVYLKFSKLCLDKRGHFKSHPQRNNSQGDLLRIINVKEEH
ncbi:hypothetical protein JCM17380_19420 [Desulfosporosinus burensis]